MLPGTSPNDPVLTESLQRRPDLGGLDDNARPRHAPDDSPENPVGHRLNDPIISLITRETTTPAEMLDVTSIYTYDVLPLPPPP